MMKITITSVVFLLATSLAAAPLSPANPVTHVRYGASGASARASVASDGNGFVAVWQTDRDQRVARIDNSGSIVGVPVAPRGFQAPAIAAFDDRYVIVVSKGLSLEADFVDDAARPIGRAIPIAVTTDSPVAVAAYGDRALIVYASHTSGGLLLQGALLSRDGIFLQRTDVLAANLVFGPAPWTYEVSASASGFAITTASQRTGVAVTILDRDGNVHATTLLEDSRPLDQPAPRAAITSDGTTYASVWTARDGSLRGAMLDANGVLLRTATIATSANQSPEMQIVLPALSYDGQQFICGFVDGFVVTSGQERHGNAYVTRFDSSLQSISDPSAVQMDNNVFDITTAAAKGSSLVVWADRKSAWMLDHQPDGAGDLHAARVIASGIADSFPLATAAAEQLTPVAASNGLDTLIAWNEQTGSASTTMAGVLDSAGRWREIGAISPAQYQETPPLVAASNGSDFLVVSGGVAVRMTSYGLRSDVNPIVLPEHFRATSAVWDGQRYVIAGNQRDGNPVQTSLAVVTIDASGSIGTIHVLRSSEDGDVADPMLAWSGNAFLMTFRWFSPPECGVTGGACLIVEGAHALLLTPAFDASPELKIGPDDAVLSTAVAWNGSEFLAIATDYHRLIGTRILPDGTSLGTAEIYRAPGLEPLGQPSIHTESGDFVVAWRSNDSGSRSIAASYLMTVRPDGTASEPIVIDNGVPTSDPVLLSNAGQQLVVSTHAVSEEPWYGASRVVIQTTGAEAMTAPTLTYTSDGAATMLQWTAVSNAAEYRLEYRIANDPWREVDISLGLTQSVSLHLLPNTRWEFRIRGWTRGGASPYSNVISIPLPRRRAA